MQLIKMVMKGILGHILYVVILFKLFHFFLIKNNFLFHCEFEYHITRREMKSLIGK